MYNYRKNQLKEEVIDQMPSDIVTLPITTPLSAAEPALPQYTQPDQTVLDRPVRANRTNRANRANIRLCVDGVSLELEYDRITELLQLDNGFDNLPPEDRLKQRQLILKKIVDAYIEWAN